MPQADSKAESPALAFPGFPDFRANVTYCPVQFFTVTIPHSSRGCVRLVGYMIRRVLGWVDEHGNPTEERLVFSNRELAEAAAISRSAIPEVLEEALGARFIRCASRPSPHLSDRPARSGAYELLWDEASPYTDDPREFRGFYFPEAWITCETQTGKEVRRAKASRKNIPNAFFDVVIPQEPLSVVRTVGALLFYSIQWGKGGERKAPVSKSITELSVLTKLSRHHTHEALSRALDVGYVERVAEGTFDPQAGLNSKAATYAIRWLPEAGVRTSEQPSQKHAELTATVQKGERGLETQRPKKVNGETAQKGERERPKKVNGERPKKVNGIILKLDPKTLDPKTTAAEPTPVTAVPVALAAAAVKKLESIGFDLKTAQTLAEKRSPDVISRQIGWLPLRNAMANPLGLLRRAIEDDWPEPKVPTKLDETTAARTFAEHFYGAYQGTPDQPATNVFKQDEGEAERFLAAIGVSSNNLEQAKELGRRFGQFVRAGQGRDPKAKPYLSGALVQFGSAFRRKLRAASEASTQTAIQAAKEAHQDAFSAEYMAYLGLREKSCQTASPAFYEAFANEWQKRCDEMANGRVRLSAQTLARLQTDTARIHAFVEYARKTGGFPILEFWDWDAQENPTPFRQGAPP